MKKQAKLIRLSSSALRIPPGPKGTKRRQLFKKIKEGLAADPAEAAGMAKAYNTCADSDCGLGRMKFEGALAAELEL